MCFNEFRAMRLWVWLRSDAEIAMATNEQYAPWQQLRCSCVCGFFGRRLLFSIRWQRVVNINTKNREKQKNFAICYRFIVDMRSRCRWYHSHRLVVCGGLVMCTRSRFIHSHWIVVIYSGKNTFVFVVQRFVTFVFDFIDSCSVDCYQLARRCVAHRWWCITTIDWTIFRFGQYDNRRDEQCDVDWCGRTIRSIQM